ncbi:hypothetical protein MiTa_02849 [Microcystis aeruginosa NIES-4264]|nr:hypothetical protein MiTa_02849 [Microcystis aeruginosa NIES-4264]
MLLTAAVAVIIPGVEGAVTIISKVLVAPCAKSPRSKVRVLPDCCEGVVVEETKVTSAGKVSTKVTFLESIEPLLVTVTL